MKKREANFELLRIISMMMIICLHYLSKGELLPPFIKVGQVNDFLFWLIEGFSIVAVNVFVLISGYFLIEKEPSVKKIATLWGQVFFYAIFIPIVLIVTGILPISDLNIYRVFPYVFPIFSEHYWFATAYIIMYLFTPLLNKGLKALTKEQHRSFMFILIAVFSISKSVLPFVLPSDHFGSDFVWFICLYVIAAYIRLYGISFFSSKRKAFVCYLVGVGLLFLTLFGVGLWYQKTGAFLDFVDASYDYNHIFNLFASVSLFYVFSFISVKREKVASVICRISPYVFGVYLLHEHIELRYLWPIWLQVKESRIWPARILHLLTSVIVVFAVGIFVDYIRTLLFRAVTGIIHNNRNKMKQ